ncbi:MAG: DUF2142 domain-containing protein [Cyanobacteriota bacterium]|nr:DUF2142 domain-containing protein [Cyanobacteriota bacterium]
MFDKIQFWRSPGSVFTIIGSIVGLLFIVLIPPFQSPDEYQHFYRSFQLSEGQIIAEYQEGDCYGYSNYFPDRPCAGGTLPKSLLTTVRDVSREDLRFRPENKQQVADILAILDLPLNPNERVFIKFPTIVLYSPIPYLPQVMGILTAKVLGLSPLGMMYMGRLFNLLFWLSIGYLVIRISPIFKWGFASLLLMPMSVFQSASLSADVFAITISFLWLSFCLYCALIPDEINRKSKITLFILPLLLALTKQAYLPLIFLFWLIPISKFENLKKYIYFFVSILLTCLVFSLTWYKLANQIYVPLFDNVSLSGQLEFLVSHPFHLFWVVANSLTTFGLSYLSEFIGKLGWLDTPLPPLLVISYLLFLIVMALGSCDRPLTLSPIQKLICATIAILNFGLIITLFYLTLTPVGADKVIYIQGRYLIPLSPLVLLPLSNSKFNWIQNKSHVLSIGYLLMVETVTAITLLDRYYF